MAFILEKVEKVIGILNSLRWLPPLLSRIVLAYSIGGSGWQKLQNVPKTAAYFESLKIPHPLFNVYFVSSCEVFFSLLLLVGLFTRIAVIPLSIVMIVAIVTARADQAGSLYALTGVYEFIYLLVFLHLFTYGAGAVSLDAWLRKNFKAQPENKGKNER